MRMEGVVRDCVREGDAWNQTDVQGTVGRGKAVV